MFSWLKRDRSDAESRSTDGADAPKDADTLGEMSLSEILQPVDLQAHTQKPDWLSEETGETPHPQLSDSYIDVDYDRLRQDRLNRGDPQPSDPNFLSPRRDERGPAGRAFTRVGDAMLGPIRLVYDNLGTLFVAILSLLALGAATWALLAALEGYAWRLI